MKGLTFGVILGGVIVWVAGSLIVKWLGAHTSIAGCKKLPPKSCPKCPDSTCPNFIPGGNDMRKQVGPSYYCRGYALNNLNKNGADPAAAQQHGTNNINCPIYKRVGTIRLPVSGFDCTVPCATRSQSGAFQW